MKILFFLFVSEMYLRVSLCFHWFIFLWFFAFILHLFLGFPISRKIMFMFFVAETKQKKKRGERAQRIDPKNYTFGRAPKPSSIEIQNFTKETLGAVI